jgi:ketosteroid isomerase-like protein
MANTEQHPNQKIVERYFEAYSKHNMNGIREVMDENVTWYFLGDHPLAGVKKGLAEVVAFFDKMGAIMAESQPKMDKLITAANDKYFIECQHSITNRADGNNLDHYTTVLWTIENGKIIEGRHFFANPQEVNKYFTAVGTETRRYFSWS